MDRHRPIYGFIVSRLPNVWSVKVLEYTSKLGKHKQGIKVTKLYVRLLFSGELFVTVDSSGLKSMLKVVKVEVNKYYQQYREKEILEIKGTICTMFMSMRRATAQTRLNNTYRGYFRFFYIGPKMIGAKNIE
jgi:hypothetical protein